MQPGEALTEKNCAEQNIHQRRHEITEAGFDDATNVHRINKQKPVRGDGEAAGQTKNSRARRAYVGDQFRPAPLPAQNDREKDCRPNKSVRENLGGWNGGEKFPINRDQTPSREGGDSSNESGRFARVCGMRALATASPSVGGQDRHPRTVATASTAALI